MQIILFLYIPRKAVEMDMTSASDSDDIHMEGTTVTDDLSILSEECVSLKGCRCFYRPTNMTVHVQAT